MENSPWTVHYILETSLSTSPFILGKGSEWGGRQQPDKNKTRLHILCNQALDNSSWTTEKPPDAQDSKAVLIYQNIYFYIALI